MTRLTRWSPPSSPERTWFIKTKGARGTIAKEEKEREGEKLLALLVAHRIMSTMLTERVNTAGRINRLTAGGSEDGV